MNDLMEVKTIVAMAKKQMKAIIEDEGYVLPEDATFEVNLKFKTEFGVEIEPKWSIFLRSYNEQTSLLGLGDTIDAALTDFWKYFRREQGLESFPTWLKNKGESGPIRCKTPGRPGCSYEMLDSCTCVKKGGEG